MTHFKLAHGCNDGCKDSVSFPTLKRYKIPKDEIQNEKPSQKHLKHTLKVHHSYGYKQAQARKCYDICFHSQKELVFSPSVGVEFMTQMGIHFPEYVASGVELHTNMFHESSLKAKITMEQKELKLSIPAPKETTKLFRIR